MAYYREIRPPGTPREVTLRHGRLRVTLAVAGASWLERLLLRLGSGATVVRIDEELGGPDLAARAAERVLARYQPAVGPSEAAR